MNKIMQSINGSILILFTAGMILILLSFSGFITSFLPPVTFEDLLNGREIKIGSHVEGNVVYALDYFASDTTYETYAFLKGGQKPRMEIFIDGEIIPMKQKLIPYFHRYLSDAGYSAEEINAMGSPFLIQPRAFIISRILFAAGILFLFLSVLIFRRIYRRFSILEEFSKDMPVT